VYLAALLASLTFSCFQQDPILQKPLTIATEIAEQYPLDAFGYPTSVGHIKRDVIQPNESLYALLEEMGMPRDSIYQVSRMLNRNFGFRFVKENQVFFRYEKKKPSLGKKYAPILILMESNVRYLKIDWQNNLLVEASSKPIDIRLRQVEGIISSSLYESLISQGHSTGVGIELSELFAWQIDFFTLYKGDRYRAIYEEFISDGEVVGVGRVIAAEFIHQNRRFEAYYYSDEQQQGYYDADGNGIQKALLKAPFTYNQRISSSFNYNRFHPVLKQRVPHTGTDYAAPLGTPVIAVGDGVVTESRYRGVNGNIVQIQHNGMYRTAYLHLNGFGPGIRKGVEVKQGQVIGYVGRTGRVTGVHLHYTLYKNNVPVNSVQIDLPSQESIKDSSRDSFALEVQKLSYLLSQGGIVMAINNDLNAGEKSS
jgi:murein DD-endopeptidase MepM/ murein hydrolase activator NlpD